MTFCSLTKYKDNPPLIRLYPNSWPFYRTRHYTKLWKVYIEFATVCYADMRRFLLRRMVPSHSGLAHVLLEESNSFPKFVVIFPDYAIRTSLGSFRFCFQYYNLTEFHLIFLIIWPYRKQSSIDEVRIIENFEYFKMSTQKPDNIHGKGLLK